MFTQDQETPRVVVIDTATNAVVRSIPLPRIAFSSVITNDGRWLLANTESGKLFVVDLGSGALTKTFNTPDVPVLPTPGEFALTADGTHAYLSCPGRHHRGPESERSEARRAHSALERRGWHGLGAFGYKLICFQEAVIPRWPVTLPLSRCGRLARQAGTTPSGGAIEITFGPAPGIDRSCRESQYNRI